MSEAFSRTELLIGEEGVRRFREAKVAVFGVGGVGGYAAEALVRSGIGHFLLVDHDTVSESNLNRQILALHSTVGRHKTQVLKERMLDIFPEAEVKTRECFFLPENAEEFSFAVPSLKVVYSMEEARTPGKELRSEDGRKVTPGSMVFVPGAAGLLLASEVVKDLLGQE